MIFAMCLSYFHIWALQPYMTMTSCTCFTQSLCEFLCDANYVCFLWFFFLKWQPLYMTAFWKSLRFCMWMSIIVFMAICYTNVFEPSWITCSTNHSVMSYNMWLPFTTCFFVLLNKNANITTVHLLWQAWKAVSFSGIIVFIYIKTIIHKIRWPPYTSILLFLQTRFQFIFSRVRRTYSDMKWCLFHCHNCEEE